MDLCATAPNGGHSNLCTTEPNGGRSNLCATAYNGGYSNLCATSLNGGKSSHCTTSTDGGHSNLCKTSPNGGYSNLCVTAANDGGSPNLCTTNFNGPSSNLCVTKPNGDVSGSDLHTTNIEVAKRNMASLPRLDITSSKAATLGGACSKLAPPSKQPSTHTFEVIPESSCQRVSFANTGIRQEDLHGVPGAGDPVPHKRGLEMTVEATNVYIPNASAAAAPSAIETTTAHLPPECVPQACPQQPVTSAASTGTVQTAEQRQAWAVGSVLEVFSATAQRWFVATVLQAQRTQGPDVLTVQFWRSGEAQMKQIYRSDAYLEVLGAHTAGEMPPGFKTLPSQSRPGHIVYLDTASNQRYASVELAWKLHFERLLKGQATSSIPAQAAHTHMPYNAAVTAYGPTPTAVACR
jgi:hypothetical protein